MSWIVLIVSGFFEAIWAVALGKSEGFSKLWPSVIFFIGLVISMAGLAWAMRDIPTGTAYAVWVGIGASLAVFYGIFTGDESFSWVKMLLILGLIGCIIGLKIVSD
ncbi:MAG: multidrug efflux SMR transporter [Microbacteriaceae bacterium]